MVCLRFLFRVVRSADEDAHFGLVANLPHHGPQVALQKPEALLQHVVHTFGEILVCREELEGDALRSYDDIYVPSQSFGVRMGGHGRIRDPGQYVVDLAAHIESAGGRSLRVDVTGIVKDGGLVTGVRLSGETLPCDAVVIATGAWSGPLSKSLGVPVPLETERGYHLELWNPSVMPKAAVMIASGKFVATPMDGRLRLAGVVEFGGLSAPPSRAPFRLLETAATQAIPGLTWERKTEWMGHRPAPADSIPINGAFPGQTGGRLLSQLVSGRKPNLDLTPYSPARFSG